MTKHKIQIRPYPLGAHCEGDGIRFTFVSDQESCGILIYDKETGKRIEKIPFDPELKIGDIYCYYLTKYNASQITYQFYEGERIVPDENAAVFAGRHIYGKERNVKDLKAGFVTEEFDWQNDRRPQIPYEDCICYLLHVRGFTAHSSSGVSCGGTFRGIIEKLSYLQEIGVTTVELQPAYEFLEIPTRQERRRDLLYPVREEDLDNIAPKKLNYWGYKQGFYYAPKAAYAAGEPCTEFKEMVREFHKRGMEVIMQFYFPKEVSYGKIPEILRHWLVEYHVDGFHLLGENLPAAQLAQDPALADTKIWYHSFDMENVYPLNPAYQETKKSTGRNLAIYQDDYLYTMRKFLKGDEETVRQATNQMRHIPEKMGRIHYLSNYYGMTLMDTVSYDRKHNEDNGEDNRDGSDYNCTWNCGEEGRSRRKKVLRLRRRQYKNAVCMLLLSQSTPLIFMGDEFGNSQKGNNNPYCQDNIVTWLDWRDAARNEELLSFWKQLVGLRKAHPILHPENEMRIMDYIACGYPDLSYHGESAWRPQMENYSRCIGIMYCGKYVKIEHTREDDFFYIAINMHWEPHEFGLPRLPKGLKWESCLTSYEDVAVKKADVSEAEIKNISAPKKKEKASAGTEAADTEAKGGTVLAGIDAAAETRQWIPDRSITVFHSVLDKESGKTTVKRVRKRSDYRDKTIF